MLPNAMTREEILILREKVIYEDINIAHQRLGHINEKQLCLTYANTNIKLTRKLDKCESCMISKAKRKPIKNITGTHLEIPGERIFLDSIGPFGTAIDGIKYWTQAVDNASRIGFCYFMKKRSEIGTGFKKLIVGMKPYGHTINKVRCNNAGKNKSHIHMIAEKHGIMMEYTAPKMQQYKGIAECQIAVVKEMSKAMMKSADLLEVTQNFLCLKAVR